MGAMGLPGKAIAPVGRSYNAREHTKDPARCHESNASSPGGCSRWC